MKKKRSFSIGRLLRRLLLVLVLLLFSLYGALHTPWVQDAIAAEVSTRLSTEEQQISLEGLRCRWPFSIRLAKLEVEDAGGSWLQLKDVSLRWAWHRDRIVISSLTTQNLDLSRLPEQNGDASNEALELPHYTGKDLELKQIQIKEFRIDKEIAGDELRGALSGSAQLNAREGLASQVLLSSEILRLDSTVALHPSSGIRLEAKGSLFDQHSLELKLEHSEEEWKGSVSAHSPRPFQLLKELQGPLTTFGIDSSEWTAFLPEDPAAEAPVQLTATFEGNEQGLRAEGGFTIPGGTLEGSVEREPDTGNITVSLKTQMEQLLPLASLMGHQLEGAVRGTTDLSLREDGVTFTSRLQSSGIKLEGVSFGDSQLNVSGNESGMEGSLQHRLQIAGNMLEGSTDFLLRPRGHAWTLTLQDMQVSAPPLKVSSTSPVSLSMENGAFSLQPADLNVNGIPLSLEGKGNQEEMDVSVTIKEFEAEDLPKMGELSLDGTLTGGIRLRGNWQKPIAELSCDFERISLLLEEADTNVQLSGRATGTWSETGLKLSATTSDQHGNRMAIEVGSPEGWSLSPLQLPDETADVSVRIKGKIDLSLLNRFQFLENQRITGQLETDVILSKKEGVTDLEGMLQMSDGTYDHFRLGSRFQQLNVHLKLKDRLLTIEQTTGRTPGGGTISVSGQWNTEDLPGTGNLELRLQNARLLHLDPVRAAVSGRVTVSKQEEEILLLGGNLVLESTEFDMDRLPQPVPQPVAFTIKGAPDPAPEAPKPEDEAEQGAGLTAQGDITLSIPSTLIVKGQNVYSTWMGDFQLGLKPEGVQLNGKLSPRRGTVNFFGRTFRFSKGTVHFNNTLGTPPLLDLEAEYSREDLDAVLIINGLATDPSFRLRSNPPLPEDEVLSRILFGKDMASITGLQALELGMALRSMMDNQGSGRDLMGKARNFLNVDQLELRESGDAAGSTEIVAGRQINNNLYLEVNQSLTTPGTSIKLEYEIRRNFSITTETGTHTLPGIGVNWKRDY